MKCLTRACPCLLQWRVSHGPVHACFNDVSHAGLSMPASMTCLTRVCIFMPASLTASRGPVQPASVTVHVHVCFSNCPRGSMFMPASCPRGYLITPALVRCLTRCVWRSHLAVRCKKRFSRESCPCLLWADEQPRLQKLIQQTARSMPDSLWLHCWERPWNQSPAGSGVCCHHLAALLFQSSDVEELKSSHVGLTCN